jgi:NitT/TauT family transport system ATP-binding protein/sulfonate transport system ATP-binding protein
MEAAALRLSGITKAFRTRDGAALSALENVSLTVSAGQIVAVIGPSGCGKSTLLRLVAGLDEPTLGDLIVGGKRIHGPSAERGLMFQDPTLFPWLTVRGNIEAGPRARGMFAELRHEVDEYLETVGLLQFSSHYPHQLSGGMAQRTALARVLINHPKVLLLDEPLGALDQFTRMRMQDEVLRLWQMRRTTTLLVTHDIDEAIYMSDRIVVMSPRPGRIERVIDVGFDRPRRRGDAAFLALRAEILEALHFDGGDPEE